MSEQMPLIRNKTVISARNIKAFYSRYNTQLDDMQVEGVHIDKKYLWKRFCKLNGIPKKLYKWSSQDAYNMNAMTEDELYRAIVKASGSILQEIL